MIEPVHSVSITSPSTPISSVKVGATTHLLDTLCSAKKSQLPPLFQKIVDFLSQVWNWVKDNLLFLFYDKNEEHGQELIKELTIFLNHYLDQQNDSGPQSERLIAEKFNALPVELKDLVKAKILERVRKLLPRANEARLQNILEGVLSEPNKYTLENDDLAMCVALLDVKIDLIRQFGVSYDNP